jgi:hypothetical protein
MRSSRPLPRGLKPAAVLLALATTTIALGLGLQSTDSARTSCTRICPPPRVATWHYQLQGKLGLSGARVHDIDGVEASASFVSRLHKRGRYAVCYVDAGTWESWRPDKARFPDSVLGRGNGWPGERWLDIRRLGVLVPIMKDRFETCRRKKFDAVEPDNVDGYANRTGFSLSANDQLAYNRRLARLAHGLGLAVALKNDLDQVSELRHRFDFAIVEQCFELGECDKFRPFARLGKPIFDVEYAHAGEHLPGILALL